MVESRSGEIGKMSANLSQKFFQLVENIFFYLILNKKIVVDNIGKLKYY